MSRVERRSVHFTWRPGICRDSSSFFFTRFSRAPLMPVLQFAGALGFNVLALEPQLSSRRLEALAQALATKPCANVS